jgi:hypothetical protein
MKRTKKHLLTGGLLLGALAAPAFALADSTPTAAAAATPAPTPTPVPWYGKLTVGGYVDEYYQFSLNRPADSSASSVQPLQYRAFDTTTNQFTFGGGELTLKQGDTASNTGYFVDLLLGPLANLYNVDGSTLDSVEIGQAYVTQVFGNATFTLGKFGTPIGNEVTYLPSNANFSRSLLFYNEPLYETGLRLDYALPGSLVVSGFVDNGNSVDNVVNSGKDWGAIIAYSGVKGLSLTGTYYLNPANTLGGATVGTDATGDIANIDWFNLVAAYTATDSLSFTGEYLLKDYIQPVVPTGTKAFSPKQQGYALYATYTMGSFTVSPRFEQWFNPDFGSSTGVNAINLTPAQAAHAGIVSGTAPYQLDDITVTLKYAMGPLSHILEYRADASDRYEFLTGNVPNGAGQTATWSQVQNTITYAAVYSF